MDTWAPIVVLYLSLLAVFDPQITRASDFLHPSEENSTDKNASWTEVKPIVTSSGSIVIFGSHCGTWGFQCHGEEIPGKECQSNGTRNPSENNSTLRDEEAAQGQLVQALVCRANKTWLPSLKEVVPCQAFLLWRPSLFHGPRPRYVYAFRIRSTPSSSSERSSSKLGPLQLAGSGWPMGPTEGHIATSAQCQQPVESESIKIIPDPNEVFSLKPDQESFSVMCFVKRTCPVPLIILTTQLADGQVLLLDLMVLSVDQNLFDHNLWDIFVEFRVNRTLFTEGSTKALELELAIEQGSLDRKIFAIQARLEPASLSPGLLALVIILSLLVLLGTALGLLICYKKHLLCFQALSRHDDLQRQIASPNVISFPRFYPGKAETKELHYITGIESIQTFEDNLEDADSFELNEYDDEPDFNTASELEPTTLNYAPQVHSEVI